MRLVGILLVAPLALMAVESVGYVRGGYNGAFWKLPLDEKLDHIDANRRDWWWISIWGLVGLFLLTAGVFGLTAELAAAGSSTTAHVALGAYIVSALAWVYGLVIQCGAMAQAATQRGDTGETPSWVHPFWQTGYVSEVAFIVGANLAYVILGIAIIDSGLLGDWVGWVSIAVGVAIPVIVTITRYGFPQLAILIPAVIGTAAIIDSL